MQTDVRFPCDDGHQMHGVLTLPDGDGDAPQRRPGLLLIYEIMGLNEEMERVARDLAAEGYVVLIPDLFDRAARVVCVARAIKTMATGKGPYLDDLEAARRWLVARPDVDGERLGAIGFCMGGAFTLLLASQGRYRAVAPFYGKVPDQMPSSCPVVASFGARDSTLREDPARLKRHLTTLGVPHDVKVYEGAGHSFYTRTEGFFLQRIGPLLPMHAEYHEEAARDARARVLAFFKEHLA